MTDEIIIDVQLEELAIQKLARANVDDALNRKLELTCKITDRTATPDDVKELMALWA